MPYIFIDESGQLTNHSYEKYFIVASFSTYDPRQIAKNFRLWCKNHFPKKMRGRSEIKWSSSGITDKMRLRTLRYIAKLNLQIRFVSISNNNIPYSYRHKGKLKGGLLYTDIIGIILSDYLPITDGFLRVLCDKTNLSGFNDLEFAQTLKMRLRPYLPENISIQIEMSNSAEQPNIQIADWIAGAIARYFEQGHLGNKCHKILEKSIASGIRLFNDE